MTVSCPPISLSNGTVHYNQNPLFGGYFKNTDAFFSCNYGYILNGPSEVRCLVLQNVSYYFSYWSKSPPTCERGKKYMQFFPQVCFWIFFYLKISRDIVSGHPDFSPFLFILSLIFRFWLLQMIITLCLTGFAIHV